MDDSAPEGSHGVYDAYYAFSPRDLAGIRRHHLGQDRKEKGKAKGKAALNISYDQHAASSPSGLERKVEGDLRKAQFGVMRINHPDQFGRYPYPRWEADVDYDEHLLKVDLEMDSPDNLPIFAKRYSELQTEHKTEDHTRTYQRRVQNARALGFMHRNLNDSPTWMNNPHGPEEVTPAVHVEYADSPQSSYVLYSRFSEKDRADVYNRISRDRMFHGPRMGLDRILWPGSQRPENPMPADYDLPPSTSKSRAKRRDFLDNLDPELRYSFLQEDYDQFHKLYERFQNERLPRLQQTAPNHQFRVVKSKSHQRDTRLPYTRQEVRREHDRTRQLAMRSENLGKQRDGINRDMNDTDSSDDEFQAPRQGHQY